VAALRKAEEFSMLDRRSRITVVGATRRLDVAVPTDTPVGEYSATLARLCGQARGGALPPAWTLATGGSATIPIDMSLAEAGITDGQVLYLRDVARDPGAAPVVEDIGEIVSDETERQRAASPPKGLATLSFGLLWLALSAWLVALRPGGGLVSPAVLLLAGGLAVLVLGWVLHQMRTPVPPAMRVVVSMAAVPCLAVAGGLVGQALAGPQFFWLGVLAGANVATLMALATAPDPVIAAVEVPLAAAVAVAVLVHQLRTDLTPAAVAAVVAVTALAVIGVAKPLAGTIAAWSTKVPGGGPAVAQATAMMLRRARQTLAVLLAGPAVALMVALPVLAITADRQPYAIALAGAASLALLVRTRRAWFSAEVVLAGAAASVGAFAVLAALTERYLSGGGVVFVLVTAAIGVVGAGAASTVWRPPDAAARESEPTLGGPSDGPDRFRWIDVMGMLGNIASAVLAMAVFGVFDQLVGMGRGIIG
jgi:hypothetical protein